MWHTKPQNVAHQTPKMFTNSPTLCSLLLVRYANYLFSFGKKALVKTTVFLIKVTVAIYIVLLYNTSKTCNKLFNGDRVDIPISSWPTIAYKLRPNRNKWNNYLASNYYSSIHPFIPSLEYLLVISLVLSDIFSNYPCSILTSVHIPWCSWSGWAAWCRFNDPHCTCFQWTDWKYARNVVWARW